MSLSKVRVKFVRSVPWIDLIIFLGLCFLVYALLGVAQEWAGPYRPKTEIDLSFWSLLRYSFFSLVRVFAAYLLSLLFTFTYGYWAAKSKRAEPVLISLLDILQSVPVLGFMPGLVLALVNLFPHSNLGLELATVLMVFTCEGWNMVFSFYSSLKAIPPDLIEMGKVFRMRKTDIFYKVEVPYAMNGLLWNSMLSMAGGWFYLMIMESFTLGDKDFRLPGMGSYMAVAYERGDSGAIVAGILVMFVLIIVVDRCLWAPLVAWSDRFKYERDKQWRPPRSLVLDWLRRSEMFHDFVETWIPRLWKWGVGIIDFARGIVYSAKIGEKIDERTRKLVLLVVGAAGIVMIWLGFKGMFLLLFANHWSVWLVHLRDTLFTLLRVSLAVVIGSLWTIPVGVFIGTHPVWTRRLQPVVQVVASFPAPMVFPVITYLLIKMGVSLEFGSVILMLFASQWYILFNVISGATMIPPHIFDLTQIFRVRGIEYWRSIIIPAIMPSLVNGWITAAGGAWNSCIVSEYVMYGTNMVSATGIGASISLSTQQADYARLAGATLTMVLTVVLLNRFFWGALYKLSETKYRVE